jgi:ABC-type transporter Mla subunit MlaD
VAAWKKALQQQEGIIGNLEQLLAAAVGRTREADALNAQLNSQIAQLNSQLDDLRCESTQT